MQTHSIGYFCERFVIEPNMELNSKGRNLLKEDPNVWSCENCHDSNQYLIHPVLPMVMISITEDSAEIKCDMGDCDDTVNDTKEPEPLIEETSPVPIQFDPVRAKTDLMEFNPCLLSSIPGVCEFKTQLAFNATVSQRILEIEVSLLCSL